MSSDRTRLEAAYRDTDYRVDEAPNGPFVIRVGECCADLEELLLEEVALDWAYLTACNPGSIELPADENVRRTVELREALVGAGWKAYGGVSAGRDGIWEEPSFLALDIPESAAVDLARRFGQNAIVAGRIAEPARLVWVD
jgi:hypothetical protein